MEKGREEGMEKGREEESFSIAQNLVKLGLPIETIISATQLDPEKVKALYQQ
jgi:predicted transposase/invertase (TIGR01784 family)